MRFVAIKTEDQQAILMQHRTRELLVRQRGMLINALRAHLHELGIIAAQGGKGLNELIALVNDKTIQLIPDLAREAMILVVGQLDKLTDHLKIVEKSILSWHRNHVVSRRLASIPGVGPIIASAIAATVVDPKQFKTSRQFAARLGLVPRQNSTGGKERLGRISKWGDSYIRKLLVIASCSLIRYARAKMPATDWLAALLERRPAKVAAVAMANKTARIIWAVFTEERLFQKTMPAAA